MLTKFSREELLAGGRRVGETCVGAKISRLLLPERSLSRLRAAMARRNSFKGSYYISLSERISEVWRMRTTGVYCHA